MAEIICDECSQNYIVSELWLVDTEYLNKLKGIGNVAYCHKCRKETTYTVKESGEEKMLRVGFLALKKKIMTSKRGDLNGL